MPPGNHGKMLTDVVPMLLKMPQGLAARRRGAYACRQLSTLGAKALLGRAWRRPKSSFAVSSCRIVHGISQPTTA